MRLFSSLCKFFFLQVVRTDVESENVPYVSYFMFACKHIVIYCALSKYNKSVSNVFFFSIQHKNTYMVKNPITVNQCPYYCKSKSKWLFNYEKNYMFYFYLFTITIIIFDEHFIKTFVLIIYSFHISKNRLNFDCQ